MGSAGTKKKAGRGKVLGGYKDGIGTLCEDEDLLIDYISVVRLAEIACLFVISRSPPIFFPVARVDIALPSAFHANECSCKRKMDAFAFNCSKERRFVKRLISEIRFVAYDLFSHETHETVARCHGFTSWLF